MRRRHVAVAIVCTLLVGLFGPTAPPALGRDCERQDPAGVLVGFERAALDSFVVEFAARADLAAAAATEGMGGPWAGRLPSPHGHGRAVAVGAKAFVRATPGATGGELLAHQRAGRDRRRRLRRSPDASPASPA